MFSTDFVSGSRDFTQHQLPVYWFYYWFSWRVHLSYGVCSLRARVHLKTLSSLLKVPHLSLQVSPLVLHNHPSKICWWSCYYSQLSWLQQCYFRDHVCGFQRDKSLFAWSIRPATWLVEQLILHQMLFVNWPVIRTYRIRTNANYLSRINMKTYVNKFVSVFLFLLLLLLLLLLFLIIIFVCSWNYQEQIDIHVCFSVDMFSLLEEGVKLARNFLLFWNSYLHC